MCAADAWVFARVLGVRVRLVRGCWRGCKGDRFCAGFDGPAYNLRIATLRAAEEICGLRHEDERVVLLFLVVVRAVEELAESRVVCLRDSAWVSGAAGGVGGTPAGRCAMAVARAGFLRFVRARLVRSDPIRNRLNAPYPVRKKPTLC